ncbi:MAG: hypothetical protein B7733_25690 [Myxococcales bacterium FL481]|nr:MAG: hypothetical protein B7733_25690 [Myxococcales bacterium FL481]
MIAATKPAGTMPRAYSATARHRTLAQMARGRILGGYRSRPERVRERNGQPSARFPDVLFGAPVVDARTGNGCPPTRRGHPQAFNNTDESHDTHDAVQACLTVGCERQVDSFAPPEHGATGLCMVGEHVAAHVGAAFDGRDRERLERQVKYMLRQPIARDDVETTSTRTLRMALKRPTARGAWFSKLTHRPVITGLAALVSPPRLSVVRCRGVLLARHRLRPFVVPRPRASDVEPHQLAMFRPRGDRNVLAEVPTLPRKPSRISSDRLLSRVFSLGLLAPLRSSPFGLVELPAADVSVAPTSCAPMSTIDIEQCLILRVRYLARR